MNWNNTNNSTFAWTCHSCQGQGVIEHPTADPQSPICVVCSNCKKTSAMVWCPQCGQSGQIAETDFSEHPLAWSCQYCHTVYELPLGFYNIHVHFTPQKFPRKSFLKPKRREDELPGWIIALDNRWKRFGEPLLVVCVFMVILSVLGLGLLFDSELGHTTIITFYTFIVVFSSLVAGVIIWGGITQLFKWIMLHTPLEPPRKQPK